MMHLASRVAQMLSRQRRSEAGDAFRRNVSQQQTDAEQHHQSGRAELDAAQQDRATAVAAGGHAARKPLCRYRDDRNS